MGEVVPMGSGANSGAIRRFFLNDNEMAALEALVHDGYLLGYVMYISGFRRRMDFNTGFVGNTRDSRVSLPFFCDMLERLPKQGSHWKHQKPTSDEIRGEIKALERAGLLRRIPKRKRTDPMLFFLPLADTGSVRAQEEHRIEHPMKPKDEPQGEDQQVRGFRGHEPQTKSANEHPYEPHMTEYYLQQQHARVILDAYHKHLPKLPKVNILSDTLLVRMADIWRSDERHQQPVFWVKFFGERCVASDFVMGRSFDSRRGEFKGNLSWLLDRKNFERIMNGEIT